MMKWQGKSFEQRIVYTLLDKQQIQMTTKEDDDKKKNCSEHSIPIDNVWIIRVVKWQQRKKKKKKSMNQLTFLA